MSEPLPRLLLVEDVPVVQAFLAAALDGLPLVVDLAGSVAGALRLAGAHAPALVLLDLHLPDGDGATALRRLRSAAVACPAVALTADPQARLDGPLAAAGFAEVAHKPLSRDAVRQLVARWLPSVAPSRGPARTAPATGAGGVAEPPGAGHAGAAPDWDDAAALSALAGRGEILQALRGLLRKDLPGQLEAIEASAATHPDQAREVLHRLQAAAAFCGAMRLAAAARTLESGLRAGAAADADLAALRAACARLLPTAAD